MSLCAAAAAGPSRPSSPPVNGAANDHFGVAVAINLDTTVVGAYMNDNKGSAYVFVRSGGSWTQQAKLTASDGAANDYFGVAVAISPDTTVVGAYMDDNKGSAYVCKESPATCTITASAGPGGSINPTGAVLVNGGSDQTFIITASTNYHIIDVLVDGVSKSAVSSYTFTDVQADHTITANFSLWTLQLGTGWNIISTPIILDPSWDTWDKFAAMGGLNYELAYYFDGTIFQIPPAGYPFAPRDALYVKMNSAATVPITPNPSITSPPSRNMVAGWNLVGSAFMNNAGELPVNEALISLYYAGGELKPYGYTQAISPALNQPGWVYIRDATTPPNMLIGKGYWVSMENADQYQSTADTP